MLRFLALAGLHFLVSFALLPDNAVVSHPVHHDDYANLATGLDSTRPLRARPVSTYLIAAVADLGPQFAYAALHLLVVACVFLALRFAELYVRDGRPLPVLGYAAAGVLAYAHPSAVDWTKYFGLLTNVSSALFGLGAMCALARMRLPGGSPLALGLVAFALAALSFWAKEDFALPLLGAALGIALSVRRLRWLLVMAGLAALYAAALLWNRLAGSVFVSGMRRPDDPYYIDLAPSSLWRTFAKIFLDGWLPERLIVATLVAVVAALVLGKADGGRKLRLALLPAIALSTLAPYAIFPNHAYAYYGFLAGAMLAATLACAAYLALDTRRG